MAKVANAEEMCDALNGRQTAVVWWVDVGDRTLIEAGGSNLTQLLTRVRLRRTKSKSKHHEE